MSNSTVRQEANQAGRDLAGRDINNIYAAQPENALARLFRQFREEVASDATLTEYIKELEIFTRHVDTGEIVGLEQKLKIAGRDDQVVVAMAMKEMVFSRLRENVFSLSFQQIYATLLGKVFEGFETWAKPAITSGKSRQEVDEILHTKVIQPIITEIENCGDYGGITPQTIRGMVFFLTGNCHIRWQ